MKKILFVAMALFLLPAVSPAEEMFPLGSQLPDFKLPDVVSGREVSPADYSAKKALLVIILCRHCPFVQHVQDGIAEFAQDYAGKDLAIVALSANDPNSYPQDAPDSLREMAVKAGFAFPVLFDETQETAKVFNAVATPDFYLFDQDRKLVYRGKFDDARPGNDEPVNGKYVRQAVEDVLGGRTVSVRPKPAVGCSIKWKPGNEPSYASR